ncbi:MAG: GPW/gp25 family protein [bacterium]|nr:GPW/gp25 family protein [bacterium]
MPNKKFLGSGMKFPPQINAATGRFMVSAAEQSVKESIYLILMTQRTERFARPGFGSNLMSYTFMDTSITALNMMKRDLAEQILTQEPRVSDVEISTDTQTKDGCLIVTIEYVVSETNQRDNLVFPFYLNAEVEEEAYEPEQYETEQYDSERE